MLLAPLHPRAPPPLTLLGPLPPSAPTHTDVHHRHAPAPPCRAAPSSRPRGATISLIYIASERTIPGYGGGMSSAKAALESDTRVNVLAYEAGRKDKIRVNTISACIFHKHHCYMIISFRLHLNPTCYFIIQSTGPLGSQEAKAIGFIEKIIEYSYVNAPLQKELLADEVGNTTAFLASPLATAISGSTIYVDNGPNTMGLALDSPTLST